MPTQALPTALLYSSIAAELGPGWTVERWEGNSEFRLFRHDGQARFRAYASTVGRLEAIAYFDSGNTDLRYSLANSLDQRTRHLTKRISCAVSRGGSAIARDIERRLLPGAEEYARIYWELVEETEQTIADLDRHTARAVEVWGGEASAISRYHRTSADSRTVYLRPPRGSGTLKVNAYKGGGVSIELNNVSLELAEALGRAYRDHCELAGE